MCEKVNSKRSIPVVKATTRLRSARHNFVALSFVAEWAIFQRLTQILGTLGLDHISSTQWIHIVEWIAPFAKGSQTGECTDLPTLTVWPWDSRFGMPTHGLTVLPLNLTVNQKALNCQTIPEGMKEYREFCAHNSRIQFVKTNLRGKGQCSQCSAMLGLVSSLECLGATAILHTTRGSRAHRDTPKKVQKSSKRVQQRALIR